MREQHTVDVLHSYALPGASVFPESVGIDRRSGDGYCGSLADGALYRLPSDGGEVELWSPAGSGGRGSVAGVKVDARGRLWAAGGYSGTLSIYDVDSRTMLGRLDVGARPSCVNDVAFDAQGNAYVTDSFVPVLFRVDANDLSLEPWVDLGKAGIPWPDGLNLNGIVLTADGGHLVSCQTNLGRFWCFDLETTEVREVTVDGGPLEHCDGLALDGPTLYAAINARNVIAVIELDDDGAAGKLVGILASDRFAFPTAVAVEADRLLVVNSQLDKMGSEPRLPFTVVTVAK
jgi:superoxide dismutase, Cu-Zn family